MFSSWRCLKSYKCVFICRYMSVTVYVCVLLVMSSHRNGHSLIYWLPFIYHNSAACLSLTTDASLTQILLTLLQTLAIYHSMCTHMHHAPNLYLQVRLIRTIRALFPHSLRISSLSNPVWLCIQIEFTLLHSLKYLRIKCKYSCRHKGINKGSIISSKPPSILQFTVVMWSSHTSLT